MQGIESNSFVASDFRKHPRSKLVVCTYNIRYAVGSHLISGSILRRFGISRPGRRSVLVKRHLEIAARTFTSEQRMPSIDVLALQEADVETRRAGRRHIARELAEMMQVSYAHACMNLPRDVPEVSKKWYLDFEERIAPDDPGDTGVAMLSRIPFAEVRRIDLPWTVCAWRPRLALQATFDFGRRRLHIFNAHVDTHASTDDQLNQHETVLRFADEATRAGEATVILGDFNTLSRRAAIEMRAFYESRNYTTPFRTGTTTWRSGIVRLQPDWIFTRGISVSRFGVVRGISVSDHLPLWVELDTAELQNEL